MFIKRERFCQQRLARGFAVIVMAAVLRFAGCETDPTIEYVERVYDPYADLAWKELPENNASIGTAKYNIGGQGRVRYEETALGNLIADGIAASAKNLSGKAVDFAFLNGQNFQNQTTIGKGAIYQSSLNAGLTDKLHVATFTAKDIFDIFEALIHSSSSGTWAASCVVVVSKEVSYTILAEENPPHVGEIKVNGVAINKDDESTTFRVATGNFFTNGTFASRSGIVPYTNTDDDEDPKNIKDLVVTVQTAVLQYIYAKGTIEPVVEGRIIGTVPIIPTTP
jgi:2',3'-cyclic-nucleotide 2'-phosphodiesterase (5'-nucleotidase family)